ncbi:hypothetical protein DFH08DRAFT_993828 [Mycena albidolilacea]|uniref:Uncharacterized protein n=1 Tax=Mycena albidolilacea TaxID=1033008 RepID=A0AAD6YYF0_9AGAR|nr:hypothetical protein DFH08DRAFT_993828 [Mycena albidolilacea]
MSMSLNPVSSSAHAGPHTGTASVSSGSSSGGYYSNPISAKEREACMGRAHLPLRTPGRGARRWGPQMGQMHMPMPVSQAGFGALPNPHSPKSQESIGSGVLVHMDGGWVPELQQEIPPMYDSIPRHLHLSRLKSRVVKFLHSTDDLNATCGKDRCSMARLRALSRVQTYVTEMKDPVPLNICNLVGIWDGSLGQAAQPLWAASLAGARENESRCSRNLVIFQACRVGTWTGVIELRRNPGQNQNFRSCFSQNAAHLLLHGYPGMQWNLEVLAIIGIYLASNGFQ